ncbi:hypothetical protein [Bosea sp. LC85]|uniref:hypothetical protein n=1 Tax=Bosea sp. LC85 TaxID=1502851 RepID=UPI001269E4AA|nr:hypothetical protein [Bosea sp. LC85]
MFAWPLTEDWTDVRATLELFATLKLHLALADDSGVSIGGLSLMLEFDALGGRQGAAVLRFCDQSNWHLGRFDFGEEETHSNRRAISQGCSGVPALVRGSHCHQFGLNERLGADAFRATTGCPPAAIPIVDDPPSFRQRMRLVSAEFNIEGLDDIPPPPFQGDLLR